MDLKQYLVIGALSVSMLTGCGSDSDATSETYGATYRGSEEAGSISAETKDGFEAMGIEIAKASLASDMLYSLIPNAAQGPMGVEASGNSVVDQNTLKMVKSLIDEVKAKDFSNLPVGIDIGDVIEATCTGTEGNMTVAYTLESSEDAQLGTYNITFNDYCSDGNDYNAPSSNNFVINGSVVISFDYEESTVSIDVEGVENTQITGIESYKSELKDLNITAPLENAVNGINTVVYNGFYESIDTDVETFDTAIEETTESGSSIYVDKMTMTAGPIVAAVSINEECSSELEGCTSTIEFTALDGKTYRVDDGEVYGEYLSGLAFDANLGSVEIDADNLDICFDEEGNVQLEEGSEIELIDSDGVELYIEATECGVYGSEISDPSDQPEAV